MYVVHVRIQGSCCFSFFIDFNMNILTSFYLSTRDEIKLDDFEVDDDEYEDTVEDITGAVGGTPSETDFGGGQIQ